MVHQMLVMAGVRRKIKMMILILMIYDVYIMYQYTRRGR